MFYNQYAFNFECKNICEYIQYQKNCQTIAIFYIYIYIIEILVYS